MTSTDDKPYASVNDQWPATLPSMTPKEALSATKRLYRLAMGKAWKGKMELTSGNRYTWVRRGTFYVNPERGWHDLVHCVSHYCHQKQHPGRKPHDFRHLFLEKTLVEHVVKSGWLEGKLQRPEVTKPKPDVKEVRYERILQRIETWERKEARARKALRKLSAQKKYYEKKRAEAGA